MKASIGRSGIYPLTTLASGIFVCLFFLAEPSELSAQENQSAKILIKYAQPIINSPNPQEAQDAERSPSDIPKQSQDETEYELNVQDYVDQPIMNIDLSLRNRSAEKPVDLSTMLFEKFPSSNYPNSFQDRLAMWRAADIRYQPLYFEDVRLERYGQTCGPVRQPLVSALNYGTSFVMLPYNLWFEKPGKCVYPLGYCQPGSLAPFTKQNWFWAHSHADAKR